MAFIAVSLVFPTWDNARRAEFYITIGVANHFADSGDIWIEPQLVLIDQFGGATDVVDVCQLDSGGGANNRGEVQIDATVVGYH